MRNYKTSGFIIARKNFGEADRIITIFTKDYGKLKVIGKGVRKITSRRAPHLELFNLSSLILSKGKNFDIITSAQTINPHSALKKDLRFVKKAYFIAELIERLCPQNQTLSNVFDLIEESLSSLNRQEELSLDGFAKKLIFLLGYLPKEKMEENFDIISFIERIIERKIRTKNFI